MTHTVYINVYGYVYIYSMKITKQNRQHLARWIIMQSWSLKYQKNAFNYLFVYVQRVYAFFMLLFWFIFRKFACLVNLTKRFYNIADFIHNLVKYNGIFLWTYNIFLKFCPRTYIKSSLQNITDSFNDKLHKKGLALTLIKCL